MKINENNLHPLIYLAIYFYITNYKGDKKMKSKKFTVALMFILLLSILTSCSGKNNADANSSNTSSSDSTTRTITHAMGTTEIKGTPKRVVILTNEGTEALLALGVKPVGAVKSWEGDPWYPYIEKDMAGVKNLGTEDQVNIEAIASLNPDLIIGNKMRNEKIYDQLSKIAPTVYSDTLRGEWKNNFLFYAKVLDKEAKGNEIIKKFDDRITDIAKLAGDRLNKKISIVRFIPGKTRLYLNNTFPGMIFKQIGFARPASQSAEGNFLVIEKERLKDADGDVIFYFTYDDPGKSEGNAREKEWINDPMFKTLDVYKNNKVYKVDDAAWNTGGGVISANILLDDLEKFLKENKI